jgi:hypothetical protein
VTSSLRYIKKVDKKFNCEYLPKINKSKAKIKTFQGDLMILLMNLQMNPKISLFYDNVFEENYDKINRLKDVCIFDNTSDVEMINAFSKARSQGCNTMKKFCLYRKMKYNLKHDAEMLDMVHVYKSLKILPTVLYSLCPTIMEAQKYYYLKKKITKFNRDELVYLDLFLTDQTFFSKIFNFKNTGKKTFAKAPIVTKKTSLPEIEVKEIQPPDKDLTPKIYLYDPDKYIRPSKTIKLDYVKRVKRTLQGDYIILSQLHRKRHFKRPINDTHLRASKVTRHKDLNVISLTEKDTVYEDNYFDVSIKKYQTLKLDLVESKKYLQVAKKEGKKVLIEFLLSDIEEKEILSFYNSVEYDAFRRVNDSENKEYMKNCSFISGTVIFNNTLGATIYFADIFEICSDLVLNIKTFVHIKKVTLKNACRELKIPSSKLKPYWLKMELDLNEVLVNNVI